jgi:glycosyltransferase involved in cell wall biosynthesis
MLVETLMSVAGQSEPPDVIVVAYDTDRSGAAVTRQAGTDRVGTSLVAYADDDDLLHPQHLERLHATLVETGADLVYPWFDVLNGTDPFPQFYGRPWDNGDPHQIPVTFLARTDVIRAAGGWTEGWDRSSAEDPGVDVDGNRAGEDWHLLLRLVGNGAKIVHLPERTWIWRHWTAGSRVGNSSGLPSRIPWEI